MLAPFLSCSMPTLKHLLTSAVLMLAGQVTTAVHAQQVPDTLHINTGFATLSADTIPALRFNISASWDSINTVIQLQPEMPVMMVVANQDSVPHNLGIWPLNSFGPTIEANSTQTITIPALPAGTYRMHSTSDRGMVLGASMMLRVGYEDLQHFQWNLNEWDTVRTHLAHILAPVDFAAPYEPRQFTINERVFPNTIADSTAFVDIALNQSVYISIVNHGYMEQVLHFHGFHVELLQSSMHPERVGWIKDTVPLYSGECVIVRLDAIQTGTYPVHAHNLIAVTNAGFYPGGMITQINVTE